MLDASPKRGRESVGGREAFDDLGLRTARLILADDQVRLPGVGQEGLGLRGELLPEPPEGLCNDRRAVFEFSTGEQNAAFECSLNDGPFEACSSPQEYGDLADGDYLFAVRAMDEAGNRDETPAQRRLTVDTTGPDARVDSGPPGVTRSRTASFGLSANEPDAGFECSLDGAAFGACSSPQRYAGLGDGTHSFQVRAVDALGNVGPASAPTGWTVDATAPEVLETVPPRDARRVSLRAVVPFSEKMNGATVNAGTLRLVRVGTSRAVPARVTYDAQRYRAILRPKAKLAPKTSYTVVVVGGTGGVEDLAGNPLATNRAWRFGTR